MGFYIFYDTLWKIQQAANKQLSAEILRRTETDTRSFFASVIVSIAGWYAHASTIFYSRKSPPWRFSLMYSFWF
jgi:hypothetical protein